jgi:hypothetical protein
MSAPRTLSSASRFCGGSGVGAVDLDLAADGDLEDGRVRVVDLDGGEREEAAFGLAGLVLLVVFACGAGERFGRGGAHLDSVLLV